MVCAYVRDCGVIASNCPWDCDLPIACVSHWAPTAAYPAMPVSQSASAAGSYGFGLLLRPFHGLANYAIRALTSAAYPIRGIWYFLRHPEFYPLFVGRLLPLSAISFLVYFLLFTFAFLPQFLFLLIFHGRAGALINTTVLVLGEGLVIIQGLFEGFFVDECRVDIFDVSPFASSPARDSP